VEGDGQEDHVVGGGGDSRRNGSNDAPMAGKIGKGGGGRAGGSAQGKTERPAHSVGDDREGAGTLQGNVLRPEHPALPRKAAGRARDGVELHLGAESAARSRPGGQAAKAGTASAEAAAATVAWDAVAH